MSYLIISEVFRDLPNVTSDIGAYDQGIMDDTMSALKVWKYYTIALIRDTQNNIWKSLKKGPKSSIDWISLKDLPSGESLFGDVPKDIFEHIPGTLSLSEERRHNKLLSKSRAQAKNDEFSVGQNNRDRDTSIHDAKTTAEKGNGIKCKIIKKLTKDSVYHVYIINSPSIQNIWQ